MESQRNFRKSSSLQSLFDTKHPTNLHVNSKDADFLNNKEEVCSYPGGDICKILLHLYEMSNLKVSKDLIKKKGIILSSLTAILCVSQEAKKVALKSDLFHTIIKQLKEFGLRLSLESVDCLRRVLDKKRICPVLKELNELVGLCTNFMVGNERIKLKFAEMGLSDLIHKLWVWFSVQKSYLVDVLQMLWTFTQDCQEGMYRRIVF